MLKKIIILSTLGTVLSTAPTMALAESIAFSSWGGTTQDAQAKNWAKPFTKKTNIKVRQDGPTNYGKIKAMVDAKSVSWDVVDVEFDYAVEAGEKGLLEKIDFSIVDKSKLDPRFVTDYAVGSFYYSFVIGFDKTAFGNATPMSWKDVFDTKKFPGKRAFYKWSAPGVIEAALLADGVKAENLYPLDLDRAFAKLDTIKKDIIWWGSGAQSQQLLASKEVSIGSFWNGRISALKNSGVDVGVSWQENITAADALVVPKGSKNIKAAMQFIAHATSAKGQADFSVETGYAPINVASSKLMSAEMRSTLPDAQNKAQINANMQYWAKHRNEIGKRWYAWQVK